LAGAAWTPEFKGVPGNFEESSLSMMPRAIYEKFVKGYTEKQWGVPARMLLADLARRFDIRFDDESRLMRHKYQGLPVEGYSQWTGNMLAGIPVLMNFDYLRNRDKFHARRLLVFTSPIDEFFDFRLGNLRYRGQIREHRYLPDVDYALPCMQVNNPQMENGPHIRTLEWKHMMPAEAAESIRGTVLTTERPVTPDSPDNYEYPFPDITNRELYERYSQRANAMSEVLICGRLGEYRYYDMDQAISKARMLARKVLDS
jgi:UDP-galactopyranose mutase